MEYLSINSLKPITFLIVFILCLLMEILFHQFKHQYTKRFWTNTLLLICSSLLGFIISKQTPLFFHNASNIFKLSHLPWGLGLASTIIIFDLAIYWQHRMSHIVPFLWKIHAIHHSDTAMDISTAYRFHPFEIYLSALYKGVLIYILSPRIEHFIIYETILFSMALFNHSNIKISKSLDHLLRFFIVTPAMHFPHHHPNKKYTNTNYGNFLSLWDRIFKSYTNYEGSHFGLNYVNEKQAKSFQYLLAAPFMKF